MQQISIIGSEIRKLRVTRGESLAATARALQIDRSHLNKIELGSYKPSGQVLERIIDHFSVEGIRANRLRDLLERGEVEHVVLDSEKKEAIMNSQVPEVKPEARQVGINPSQVPVVYTDSVFVNSSDYGLVLDIAQSVGGNLQQQFVVSRVGMSFDHAKKLIEVMNDHLEKHER